MPTNTSRQGRHVITCPGCASPTLEIIERMIECSLCPWTIGECWTLHKCRSWADINVMIQENTTERYFESFYHLIDLLLQELRGFEHCYTEMRRSTWHVYRSCDKGEVLCSITEDIRLIRDHRTEWKNIYEVMTEVFAIRSRNREQGIEGDAEETAFRIRAIQEMDDLARITQRRRDIRTAIQVAPPPEFRRLRRRLGRRYMRQSRRRQRR